MARKLDIFPAFLLVADRTITIVGGGPEAIAKARLVLETAAHVQVVSVGPSAELRTLAKNAAVTLVEEAFHPAHVIGTALVFAATGIRETDRIVVEAARAAKIPVNAVDNPDLCDFLTPAIVNRAPVAVAISTSGTGPVLARQIREKIEQVLPAGLGDLAVLAARFRQTVDKVVATGRPRRAFWQTFFSGPVAEAAYASEDALARRRANLLVNHSTKGASHSEAGFVSLVGAGPGATDLLTLRAQRLLQDADVIVHDRLVPGAVIAMGRRDAARIDVGKATGDHSKSQDEINDILIREATAGRHVVRLKDGDPLVSGRAGEEMTALRKAGIAFEVVPGVTAALAAAAAAQIPNPEPHFPSENRTLAA